MSVLIMSDVNDTTLIKTFLKKQIEIQDNFLAKLNQYKAPVDTTELRNLITEYQTAINNATHIKPRLDTSAIDRTIQNSVNNAFNDINFEKLKILGGALNRQANAIEHNNELLSLGVGVKLKIWTLLLILVFGITIGIVSTLYFEIPDKLIQVKQYQERTQVFEGFYNEFNETLRTNCKLAKAFFLARKLEWKNQCGDTYPFKKSKDI